MMRRLLACFAVAACGSSGAPPAVPAPAPATLAYVGSAACRPCHAAIYDRWKVTRMANVVRDPAVDPAAIIPDLSRPDPLLTFARADIAFVYGSRWKQRYFTRVGDDFYPLPAQWDITHGVWRAYHVPDGTDWWVPFYPKDNLQRPTGPLCDGCHSVNYDAATKTVTEWNVGCERCHGPGADHARAPAKTNIVNPARLDPVAANDVCIQCHSQGRPLIPATAGRAFDWPVGFRVGLRLREFWQLEPHAAGTTTFTHFADGTAHKNRMQGNDFVQSVMYAHDITCANCHDAHGTPNVALLVTPSAEICAQCHEPGGTLGPRESTLEAHTHHRAGSTGSSCLACHMPAIEQTLGDVMVRGHTFKFIPPTPPGPDHVPDACTMCHADHDAAWATASLASWGAVSSPGRPRASD